MTERKARILIDSHLSQPFDARSGVPQGSVLGGLIFCLFIADCPMILPCNNVLFYADDGKVFRKITNKYDHDLLQQDINLFYAYCLSWGLDLNPSKCSIMSFSLKKNPLICNYKLLDNVIPRTSSQRDLGVIFDPKCSFDAHINNLRSSSHAILSCLTYSFRNLRSRAAYLNLYHAFIFSRLTFASSIWSGSASQLLNKLVGVQTRFLRFINWRLSLPITYSSTILRDRFKIPSLFETFKIMDVRMFLKLLPDETFNDIRPQVYARSGRHKEKYFVPFLKLTKSQSFFFYRAAKIVNESL